MDEIEKGFCYVEKQIGKAEYVLKKNKYNKALVYLSMAAYMLYQMNQKYTNEQIEKLLLLISTRLLDGCSLNDGKMGEISQKCCDDSIDRQKTVLFYDGFGVDGRGLTQIYLDALGKNGYKVIYVTDQVANGHQTQIDIVINLYKMKKEYISSEPKYLSRAEQLYILFLRYKPSRSFFYSTPYDVSGVMVFDYLKGKTIRYLINLTDHTFWIGKYALDYCIEFRGFGWIISEKYRELPTDQLRLLPYYPYIDKTASFIGWPKEADGLKVIFSGGQLYKTFGDREHSYYKIVEHIIKKHKDIVFIYAGNGDAHRLNEIAQKYPGRVLHIEERKDLYEALRHSVLFLNTYPVWGGLLTQYAAVAGKIPVSLYSSGDCDGMLINQSARKIEYSDCNELMEDLDRLIDDDEYRVQRETLLKDSVIDSNTFSEELLNIMKQGETKFKPDKEEYDIDGLIRNYANEFLFGIAVLKSMVLTKNVKQCLFHPIYCVYGAIEYIRKTRLPFTNARWKIDKKEHRQK